MFIEQRDFALHASMHIMAETNISKLLTVIWGGISRVEFGLRVVGIVGFVDILKRMQSFFSFTNNNTNDSTFSTD